MTKHFPANRYSRLSRLIRAVFDRGLTGWCFKIHIGPGGGYGRWVFNRRFFIPTGWTFWFGRNVRGGRKQGSKYLYSDQPWSIGLSRGGNAPYAQH